MVRARRELRRLSLQDIADTLNLSSRVVSDIEAENWASLPAAAFTRGYLRAYAKLLEIDPDTVAQAYDAAAGRGEIRHLETPHSPRGGQQRRMDDLLHKHPGAVLTGAVTAVVGAVLVVLWAVWPAAPVDSAPAGQPAAASSGPAAPRGAPAASHAPGTGDVVLGRPEVAHQRSTEADTGAVSAAAQAEVREAAGSARRISDGGDDRLTFGFAGDSWIEIKDNAGATLFGDLGKTGTTLELVGQPPFHILLGNAPAVTLQFNGERVVLAPHTRNNVATLVLGQ
jgi:cytoskeleton protein RodZ